MNDRLEKLLRQREILREHLRWIEGEIEATRRTSDHGNPPAGDETTTAESVVHTPPSEIAPAPGERRTQPASTPEIPQIPEPDIRGLQNEVRQGCLLYVTIFALIGAAMVALIFLVY